MTHQIDVARGRDTVARWCALAEQRLEYLTELFETGRWRRFHNELAFLENIQEAKTAVEIWRDLSLREASRDHSSVDIAWLGRTGTAMPCRVTWLDPGHRMQPGRRLRITPRHRLFRSSPKPKPLFERSAFPAGDERRFGAEIGYDSDR
jgi:TIGR03809 family protein